MIVEVVVEGGVVVVVEVVVSLGVDVLRVPLVVRGGGKL